MLKPKIKVGSYYEFKLSNSHKIAFSVLYGFEKGKNKDVYTLMMYTDKKNFEFPIQKNLFDKWKTRNYQVNMYLYELSG